MIDLESVEVSCACEEQHGTHFAYLRKRLGGRAVLEILDAAQNDGEVAGGLRAIYFALVDWDIPGPNGEKLAITQQAVDELHVQQIGELRTKAIAAFREGNKPLPNASGGRSPVTSPGSRSRRRSATKAAPSTASVPSSDED